MSPVECPDSGYRLEPFLRDDAAFCTYPSVMFLADVATFVILAVLILLMVTCTRHAFVHRFSTASLKLLLCAASNLFTMSALCLAIRACVYVVSAFEIAATKKLRAKDEETARQVEDPKRNRLILFGRIVGFLAIAWAVAVLVLPWYRLDVAMWTFAAGSFVHANWNFAEDAIKSRIEGVSRPRTTRLKYKLAFLLEFAGVAAMATLYFLRVPLGSWVAFIASSIPPIACYVWDTFMHFRTTLWCIRNRACACFPGCTNRRAEMDESDPNADETEVSECALFACKEIVRAFVTTFVILMGGFGIFLALVYFNGAIP